MNGNSLKLMAQSPREFRRHLRIDVGGQLAPLADVADPWQAADFEALDAGWQRIVGHKAPDAIGRAYLERPRGHTKTADLAVMSTWALAFAARAIRGAAAAGDKDQARLLRDAIARLVRDNGWLRDVLDVQQNRVINTRTESTLEILSADAHTAYGHLLDFLIVDEITNWPAAGEQLWTALISTVAKRSNCMAVVISNAGMGQGSSWQWRVREACRNDPDWYFSRLDGPVASWISERHLAEQRRLLPEIAYRRLWRNEWTSSAGDALPDDDIDASIVLDGSVAGPEPGWCYVAGLDLGLSRDATALVVVGRSSKTGRLRVASVKSWKPRPGQRVSVESIEEAIIHAHKRFRLRSLAYDPWQSEYLAQRLRKAGISAKDVTFTPTNQKAMASAMIEAFSERAIELYGDAELIQDLRSLRVVEKSYGWRLQPVRDASGHGDRAIALALALLAAKVLPSYYFATDGSWLTQDDLDRIREMRHRLPSRGIGRSFSRSTIATNPGNNRLW